MIVGWIFLAVSTVGAVWAYTCHRRKAPLPTRFWHGLRAVAGLLGIQIILGLLFIIHGLHPRDPLHYMYAALVTLTVGACEMLRPNATLGRILREEGRLSEALVYAGLLLLAALFALRLEMTG